MIGRYHKSAAVVKGAVSRRARLSARFVAGCGASGILSLNTISKKATEASSFTRTQNSACPSILIQTSKPPNGQAQKGIALNDLVNGLLKQDIEMIESVK